MKVILLTGPAKAGKGHTANYIIQKLRHGKVFKFATRLKVMLARIGNKMPTELEKVKDQSFYKDVTYRQAMQTLGDEWGRQCIGEDFWVDRCVADVKLRELEEKISKDSLVIFDDTRYPNEILRMKEEFDTTVINIVPTFEGYEPIAESDHASENQELPYDYQIINSGFDELHRQIDEIMEEIL